MVSDRFKVGNVDLDVKMVFIFKKSCIYYVIVGI